MADRGRNEGRATDRKKGQGKRKRQQGQNKGRREAEKRGKSGSSAHPRQCPFFFTLGCFEKVFALADTYKMFARRAESRVVSTGVGQRRERKEEKNIRQKNERQQRYE